MWKGISGKNLRGVIGSGGGVSEGVCDETVLHTQ